MELINKRHLTKPEKKLLKELILKSNKQIAVNWQEGLLVSSLNDGEMGSLSLYPLGISDENRSFGFQVSDCQFKDIDGATVIAS